MSTPVTPGQTTETQSTTTTTLSETQEQLVQAMLARMGPTATTMTITPPPATITPPPTTDTPTPTQTTTTPTQETTMASTVDIKPLIESGGLTLDVLENFLSSRCTWCYTGGYAAILHARRAGTAEVATADLDILIDASQVGTVRQAMYGDNPSGTTTVAGYIVTLHSAAGGQIAGRIAIGTAFVMPLAHLQRNYGSGGRPGLGDLIKGRPTLKKTENTLEGISERDTSVSQTVDPAKAERRRLRSDALDQAAAAQSEKEKMTENKEKEKEKPDKDDDDTGTIT